MTTRIAFLLVGALAAASCETATSPTPTADTELLLREFSSLVVPRGAASREFTLTAQGAISVTLKSTTPADVVVGIGVGIPRSNGSCALSTAIEAVAGAAAQVTINAEAGTYCAKVYDPGTLTSPVPFTISISRP